MWKTFPKKHKYFRFGPTEAEIFVLDGPLAKPHYRSHATGRSTYLNQPEDLRDESEPSEHTLSMMAFGSSRIRATELIMDVTRSNLGLKATALTRS
jgi:hypothetical protein